MKSLVILSLLLSMASNVMSKIEAEPVMGCGSPCSGPNQCNVTSSCAYCTPNIYGKGSCTNCGAPCDEYRQCDPMGACYICAPDITTGKGVCRNN